MKITKMMKKFVSGVLVGMAALVGFTPLTVFAQGKEAMRNVKSVSMITITVKERKQKRNRKRKTMARLPLMET